MIYTCSHKNYQSTIYKTYAISGNRGKNVNYQGKYFQYLAPKLSFWKIWHQNQEITPQYENDYYYIKSYYYQVLKKLNPQEILNQLDNSILLCYEESFEFCHRHIVAAWLELTLDILVSEVIVKDYIITIVNRPTYIKKSLSQIIFEDIQYQSINIKNKDISNICCKKRNKHLK